MAAKKNKMLADLALVFTTLVWGSGFSVVKNALNIIGPMWILALRFAIAAFVMGIIFFGRIKKNVRKEIKPGLWAGTLLFVASAMQIIGAQWTTAGKNAFLTSVYVVIVPFLAIFFLKNKVTLYNFLAAGVCIVGVGLLTLRADLTINIGDLLTIVCAFFFAAHIIILSLSQERDIISFTFVQLVVTAALSFACAFAFEGGMPKIGFSALLSIAYLGVLGNMVGFTFQTFAQKHMSAPRASLLMSLEAVFGAVISAIVLKETIGVKIILGCLLILFSVVTAETKLEFLKRKKKPEEAPKEPLEEPQIDT